MTRDFEFESLAHDPIHGYIPFVSRSGLAAKEVAEQDIIDHPWVQRLRHIHQLQTAWWVFPSAEHMRFQHVLGVMHLASRVIDQWYDSLNSACQNVPSKAYVESLVRLAGLLHDVGHGPFGHFFDDQYLDQFGITHEDIGGEIIEQELGDLIRGIRRNPSGKLQPLEELDPRQVSFLIRRPKHQSEAEGQPEWLRQLRSLFSGIYTVDNMDFVLRDAYMTGFNTKAFDISRLIHYSFFSKSGLTIHARGLPTLIQFIETRANMFRMIYFHRTVRALDIALEELFPETMAHLFPGNPLEHLQAYQGFTESSFLVDVQRMADDENPERRELGERWQKILSRRAGWKMAVERTLNFHTTAAERMTIFSEPQLILERVRRRLPAEVRDIPLNIDVAKHYHRPSGHLPTGGQNHLFDPGNNTIQVLNDDDLFRALPVSFLIFRIYCQTHDHDAQLNAALQSVLGDAMDAKTNM
ncbi:MAG: HD domain-containing protein [Planctomycetaceae bacterium]|nr:HD domain-containing protein [Planctomycetaceae bacterium]MCB9952636.1 HD domain-containing protein [Planctomycetaceae bacterium]